MIRSFFILLWLSFFVKSKGQSSFSFADSIRINHKIPELAYAVVSSDSILDIQAMGLSCINSTKEANLNHLFRIGSNTKTITSYLAALMVKQGKLTWNAKFFDLYPELKPKSNTAYHKLTLKQLLTFRAPLLAWTYTYQTPTEQEITGNQQQQRYNFASWVLQQEPVLEKRNFYWSNPSYVLVGLMLEKAGGKSYETLVEQLGKELGINFYFGQPNLINENQPWGHDQNLEPEQPLVNYKLNWLAPAGNISLSLPHYCKFIQLQLQGLMGKSNSLTKKEFENMHYGLPEFAFGWKWYVDDQTHYKYSFHEGNPGTFLSKVFICHDTKKAFVVFCNVQSAEAEKGLALLLAELKKKYAS